MFKRFLAFFVVLGLAVGVLPFLSFAEVNSSRSIVVFKDGASESQKDAALEHAGGQLVRTMHSGGRVAILNRVQKEKLLNDESVARIDEDAIAYASRRPGPSPAPSEQIPWGITKINAPQTWSTGTGSGVKVAVIDTGIDLTHSDLAANIIGNYNAITSTKSGNDDNGHGTHVAGIIAGIDNTIGIVGVGPKISLYAVKVLGANGSGYISDIIEGMDWSVARGSKVINMSLGATVDIQSFRDAVARAHNAGVVVVAASGNDGSKVNYPAAYPGVIAVGATDSNNLIASWSSRGPEVDLAAPGVNIYSTYKGNTYSTLSGTSMATPHIAGVAAVLAGLVTPCDTDQNGSCSPDEIELRMKSTATDLGASGIDSLYGAGLVNLYAATR